MALWYGDVSGIRAAPLFGRVAFGEGILSIPLNSVSASTRALSTSLVLSFTVEELMKWSQSPSTMTGADTELDDPSVDVTAEIEDVPTLPMVAIDWRSSSVRSPPLMPVAGLWSLIRSLIPR